MLRPEVGAAGIQVFVVVQLLRVVARERLEEVLTSPGPQEEEVRPNPAGSRLTRRPDDLLELLGAIRDSRQDRGLFTPRQARPGARHVLKGARRQRTAF
jgi:hypothetical protein